jgi:hypothetical protein
MPIPRVFVSSSFYDLKHIRSSLDIFIESLGFEPILSEKGDISYSPDRPLDESCYRDVQTADIFVLIIGGRYGSEVSGTERKPSHQFLDKYESITKREYENAVQKDLPTYILIEKNVFVEYGLFLRNKENTEINYAQVDSANIFRFIDEILSKPRNNPLCLFETFPDIEKWLRKQWAGLFREYLNGQLQQQPLAALSAQLAELRAISDTMRRYLEAIVLQVNPQKGKTLVQSENNRLSEMQAHEKQARTGEEAEQLVRRALELEYGRKVTWNVAVSVGERFFELDGVISLPSSLIAVEVKLFRSPDFGSRLFDQLEQLTQHTANLAQKYEVSGNGRGMLVAVANFEESKKMRFEARLAGEIKARNLMLELRVYSLGELKSKFT